MASEKAELEKVSVEETNGKAEPGKTADSKKEAPASKKKKTQVESIYTAEELAENANNIFGTRKECVMAALKSSGIARCSVSHAIEAVEAFMKKEVR